MSHEQADFTRTFAGLADGSAREEFRDPARFDAWAEDWKRRAGGRPDLAAMAQANPRRIPRNHQVEAVIAAGREGDFAPFHALFDAVTHPREDRPAWAPYAAAPRPEERVRATFCGT